MASVDGKTSLKIDDLINDTIISGEVISGHLILTNRAGAEIDAGVVTANDQDSIIDAEIVGTHLILTTRAGAEIDAGVVVGDPGDSVSPLDFMPIGYIYTSVVSTSPATLFGGGTWVRIGQGRVLVGQDSSQTEFDTAEETGGEKNHTISSGELPAHTHTNNHQHPSFLTVSDGNHTHTLTRKTGVGTSTGVARGNATADADGTTNTATGHTHTINPPNYTGTSGSTGSGTPANNLQPYLVVYMWKRTA